MIIIFVLKNLYFQNCLYLCILEFCGEYPHYPGNKKSVPVPKYRYMRNYRRSLYAFAFAASAAVPAFALNLPVKIIGNKPYYYYTVDKKDRFYQLPEKLGVPRSVITANNPAANDGVQPGMVLTIPIEYDAVIVNGYYCVEHKATSGESLYGIAKKYNVSVDKIVEFNPEATKGVNKLKLLIPLIAAPEQASQPQAKNEEPATGAVAENKEKAVTLGTSEIIGTDSDEEEEGNIPPENTQPYEVPVAVPDTLPSENQLTSAPEDVVARNKSISLILPFPLGNQEQTKAEKLITEFYKGFLMGVEEFSHQGAPITINAFDSAVSPEEMAKLVANPAILESDIIISPDSEETLQQLAKAVEGTDTKIFNPFVVKNTDYMTNPSIIQAIIPHEKMYQKAVDAFIGEFGGKIPVFLSRIQGQADKSQFITLLKERLAAENIEFKEIAYRDFLTPENLEELTIDNSYVFIPASGNRIEFNKFAPALKSWKETGASLSIFGFPEWVTFRDETLGALGELNATIYTRFYSVENDPQTKSLEQRYKEWYGQQMMEAVPNQGVFGYDIAMFLINSLRNSSEESFIPSDFQGVQSGFIFVKPGEGAGLVNDNLYFLTFNPDGTTGKKVL